MSDEDNGKSHSVPGDSHSADDRGVGAHQTLVTWFRFAADIVFEAGDLHDAFGMIAAHFIGCQLELDSDDVKAANDWFIGRSGLRRTMHRNGRKNMTDTDVPNLEPPKEEDIPNEIALARIEAHYCVNDSFFNPDDQLLRDVGRIRHLPAVIIQRRYDMVCPVQSAWELHRAWPGSRLTIVGDAGHAADEAGISSALVEATEGFKTRV